MNKEKFKEYLCIVLEEMIQEKDNISYDIFKYVKQYIMTNKDDEDVINFKKILIEKLKSEMLNPNFINALYLPENLKYYRIQEIFKTLPFTNKNKKLKTYFYNLINNPCETYGTLQNFYNACYCFFNEENQNLMTSDMMNKINEFTSQNKALMYFGKDKYDSFDIELMRYKDMFKNKYYQDYIDFIKNEPDKAKFFQQYITDIKTREKYVKKKLGNIGELYAFELIKNFDKASFTAKELGNGFGYDMYFQYFDGEKTIENLIDVKTTATLNGDDYFTLSQNEYNVMLETLNNDYADYLICRIFADTDNNKFDCFLLKFEDETTLKSINYDNDNLQYNYKEEEYNKYKFERKEKVYTLK